MAGLFYSNFLLDENSLHQSVSQNSYHSSYNGETMATPNTSPHNLSHIDSEEEMDNSKVCLRILEHPVPMFRFRYRSEMNGAHGSLLGRGENPKKKTYPTVQLVNFDGEAIIRCSLYTAEHPYIPHMHQLIAKPTSKGEVLDHEITVSERNDYTAEFRGLGIVHMAKKNLTKELIRKKEKNLMERLKRDVPNVRDEALKRAVQDKLPQLEAEAKREADSMDANKIRLCFEAFVKGPGGVIEPICDKVLSDRIQNMKSAETGGLKISRIDKCAGSCNGGDEIYMLVEKVCKKNIQIRFFEEDENGCEVWHDYGTFTENDVHHQYAIVFRTPPYKNTEITKKVPVKVQLLRPKDGARSDSLPFHYKPAHRGTTAGQKRPLHSYSSTESSHNSFETKSKIPRALELSLDEDPMFNGEKTHSMSFPSDALRQIIDNLGVPMGLTEGSDAGFEGFLADLNLSEYTKAINEDECQTNDNQDFSSDGTRSPFSPALDEFSPFIPSPENFCESFTDLNLGFNVKIDGAGSPKNNSGKSVDAVATEGISCRRNVDLERRQNVTTSQDEKSSHLAKNTYEKLLRLMRSRHPSRLQDMKSIIRAENEEMGPLHAAVIHGQLKELSDLLSLVIKSNQLKLINTVNQQRQTPLMVAVEENKVECVNLLCMARADVNHADYAENTALHLAVKNKNHKCLKVLLATKSSQVPSSRIDVNRRNEKGETALHIAVRNSDLESVTQLVKARADLNVKTGTAGLTPLHIAVEVDSPEIVKLLLCQEKVNVNEVNFNNKTPADLIKPSQKSIILLFKKYQGDLIEEVETENQNGVAEDGKYENDNEEEEEDEEEDEDEDEDDDEDEDEEDYDDYEGDEKECKESYRKHSDSVPVEQSNMAPNGISEEGEQNCDGKSDSDSDELNIDDSTKDEFRLIDDTTRKILVRSLDKDEKWKSVCENLECGFLIRTFSSVASPSRILLTYLAEFHQKISLLQFKNALENLNVPEAVEALDKLLTKQC